MRTSDYGINFIKQHEGLRLKAYKAVPSEQFYTIGYGHYSSDIKKGTVITAEMAETFLRQDVEKIERKIEPFVEVYGFNQNQYDALVSFTYNCGFGNFVNLTKNGQRSIPQIETAIPKYNKSGGKVLTGLVRRRSDELKLFRTPVTTETLKDNRTIAHEVIGGKWGNGEERKRRLTEAGYNYEEIQAIVNRILKG